jgi:hypothetical protein
MIVVVDDAESNRMRPRSCPYRKAGERIYRKPFWKEMVGVIPRDGDE